MAEPSRGLLDTSVVIDVGDLDDGGLPDEAAISAVTLAELTAGVHAADDPAERAFRQDRLLWVESSFDLLPFNEAAARAYGLVYAAVTSAGRKARGRRAVDLFIAATARANDLPLYTRNPDDFAGLEGLITVVAA